MIKVNNLKKIYRNIKVINNLSVTLNLGKIYAIIGPSGSGKSTFLKCIAGLEEPDEGHIDYADIKQKDISFIFQRFNLFNNLTVLENLIYAPHKVFGIKKETAINNARIYLKKVNLNKPIEDTYPSSISDGQKQRVAIARALCVKPRVILYDEPTSALDHENASEVLNTIKELSKSKSITNIIVTHHMKFAEQIADKIIFFDKGKIIEKNQSKEFFLSPKSKRAKEFLSKKNLIRGV